MVTSTIFNILPLFISVSTPVVPSPPSVVDVRSIKSTTNVTGTLLTILIFCSNLRFNIPSQITQRTMNVNTKRYFILENCKSNCFIKVVREMKIQIVRVKEVLLQLHLVSVHDGMWHPFDYREKPAWFPMADASRWLRSLGCECYVDCRWLLNHKM